MCGSAKAERSQHIAERVGIITRRKMPENLIKKEQAYRKRKNQENNRAISDKVYQKVTEKADKQSRCVWLLLLFVGNCPQPYKLRRVIVG